MYSESKVNLLPQLLSVLPSFVLLMTLLCPSNAIQVVSFDTSAGHVDKPKCNCMSMNKVFIYDTFPKQLSHVVKVNKVKFYKITRL